MIIEIISDAVCPWCLIGKRNLEAALAQRPDIEVDIVWRPFQLHPDIPVEGVDRKTAIAAKFGSAENATRVYQRVSAAGAAVGVAFNFDAIAKTPNTLDAHRLIHWAQQDHLQDRIVEILFRCFFIDGQDIGDRDVLLAAAAQAGMDRAECARKLATDLDLETVQQAEMRARRLGVNGVPYFIFDNKYALSGAQPAEVIVQVLDTITRERASA